MFHRRRKNYGAITTTCEICADAPAVSDLPCGCVRRHCRACLVRHLRARVRRGLVSDANMRCFKNTYVRFSDDVLQDLLGAEDFLRLMRYRNQGDPKMRLCPRAGCDRWTRHEKAYRAGKVPCAACRAPICFRCGGPYRRASCGLGLCRRNAHAGDARPQGRCAALGEGATLAIYEWCHSVKRCPQCRAIIEKNGGVGT